MASDADELKALEQVVERLRTRFDTVPAQRVADVVDTAYREFDGAPVRNFVPIMVEKMSTDRLAHGVV